MRGLLFLLALAVTSSSPVHGHGAQDLPGGRDRNEPKLPEREYWHRTAQGQVEIFRLNGRDGVADYRLGDVRHYDRLQFDGTLLKVGSTRGWSYQVVREGKPLNLWFFFASKSLAQLDRVNVYEMYRVEGPAAGRQSFTDISTPGGTWVLNEKLEQLLKEQNIEVKMERLDFQGVPQKGLPAPTPVPPGADGYVVSYLDNTGPTGTGHSETPLNPSIGTDERTAPAQAPETAGPNPRELGVYRGEFERKGRKCRVWRLAQRNGDDILLMDWLDSEKQPRVSQRVQCDPQKGISRDAVLQLVRE